MALFSSEDKNESVQLGKSDDSSEQKEKKAKVRTIPEVFYGGNDPEIYKEKEKAKQKVAEKIKTQEEKAKKQKKKKEKEAEEAEQEKPTSKSGDNKLLKITGIVGAFIVLVGGVSAYYFYQAGFFAGMFGAEQVAQQQQQETEPPSQPEPAEEPEPEPEPETPATTTPATPTTTEETATTTPTTTPQIGEQPLEFPQVILADSTDLDSDELTDREEEVFDTDSGTWDTDGDGYYDGQEVVNLYDPEGESPAKLIDSGLVSEYENPIWQYRLYYPNSWEVAAVDDEYRQVLFSSITGDFVELRVESKQEGESFDDWFGRRVEDQSRTDISQFTNRFEETGYRRDDGLVSYFVGENNVYIVIYNTGTTGEVPFRHIMRMMFESFRPVSNGETLPQQNIIPEVPPTTASEKQTETTTQVSTTSDMMATTTTSTAEMSVTTTTSTQ